MAKEGISQGEEVASAGLGLVTGGPIGLIAAYYVFKALKGEWTPWILIGVFAGPASWILSLLIFLMVTGGAVSLTGILAAVSMGAFGGNNQELIQGKERSKVVPWDKYSIDDLMEMTPAQVKQYELGKDPFPERPYVPKRY